MHCANVRNIRRPDQRLQHRTRDSDCPHAPLRTCCSRNVNLLIVKKRSWTATAVHAARLVDYLLSSSAFLSSFLSFLLLDPVLNEICEFELTKYYCICFCLSLALYEALVVLSFTGTSVRLGPYPLQGIFFFKYS